MVFSCKIRWWWSCCVKLSNSLFARVNQREKFIWINNMNLHLIISRRFEIYFFFFFWMWGAGKERESVKKTTCCYFCVGWLGLLEYLHSDNERNEGKRAHKKQGWRYARRFEVQAYHLSSFLIAFDNMHGKSYIHKPRWCSCILCNINTELDVCVCATWLIHSFSLILFLLLTMIVWELSILRHVLPLCKRWNIIAVNLHLDDCVDGRWSSL